MPIYSTRIQHDDASYARWERAAYGDSPMSRSAYVRHDQEAEANAESWELSSARGEFPAPRAFDTSAAPRQRHMSASRNRHDAGSLAPRNARRALRWPPSVQAMGVCLLVALACTAVVALLGAALSLAASATAEMQGGELTASAPAQGEDAAPPRSTPSSEWSRGVVPALFQTDPAWADLPYSGGTIAENGCGPTALCMAYVALTGKDDQTPATMANLAEREGFAKTGATEWAFMTDGAALLGLHGEELSGTVGQLEDAFDAGHPVVLIMGVGDFTQTGHFIVAYGFDEDGMLRVQDPVSPERSTKAWDAERVLTQARNLWEMSVA